MTRGNRRSTRKRPCRRRRIGREAPIARETRSTPPALSVGEWNCRRTTPHQYAPCCAKALAGVAHDRRQHRGCSCHTSWAQRIKRRDHLAGYDCVVYGRLQVPPDCMCARGGDAGAAGRMQAGTSNSAAANLGSWRQFSASPGFRRGRPLKRPAARPDSVW